MKSNWKKLQHYISPLIAITTAVFMCLFFYLYDNKYTFPGPKGLNGVLDLTDETHSVIFLTEGWEYYSGRLLSPLDLEKKLVPDAYIFIGQYGGFDMGDMSLPPHGSASYRLKILLPNEKENYLLELPEIFSAYRAYINGNLVQIMGEPDPENYFPETGAKTISISESGEIDILIAVSDFSHLYSGLTFPPAFGSHETLSRLISLRLMIRCIFLSFACSIGALSLIVSFSDKKNGDAALFSLMCLFLMGYTGYPVIQTLGRSFYPFYPIENFSFCAMILTVILLQRNICKKQRKTDWIFICYGALMCIISIFLPLGLKTGNLRVMAIYSFMITAYQWITAIYLTSSLFGGTIEIIQSKILMCGVLVFESALIMDRLLPFYEPVVSGWFPELASFALTLFAGFAVALQVAQKYKNSVILEERISSMEVLSKMQQLNFELLQERIDETKTAQHDLRHHFVMIEGFLQSHDYDNLEKYVHNFQESVLHVQPVAYSKNPVVNVLMRHYAILAKKEGVSLSMKLEISRDIKASEADLCAVLSNLLENAIEACKRQKTGRRFIRLSMGQKPSMLSIRMENSSDEPVCRLDGSYISSKEENRKGYGLDSISTIAARYSGDTEFQYDKNNMVFISTVLLML